MSHRGRWLAAVLALGDTAVLSHVSAAALWRLIEPRHGPTHVTVFTRTRRRRGIIVHRTRHLLPSERRQHHGIPVTSVERTLLDLAGTISPTQLRRAVEAADRLALLDAADLIRRCEESSGRKGTGRLLSVLARYRSLPWTRSELERRFLRLCDEAGLPRPAVNVEVNGFEVDFLWPEHRLVVELDGYEHHRGRAAFERDRQRDVALQLAGYRVLRFTYLQLVDEPPAVAAQLGAALRAGIG